MPSCFSKRPVKRYSFVLIKLLNNKYAKMPLKGSPGAAGYDLYAVEDSVIYSGEREAIKTGVSLAIQKRNCYARLAPRSSLAMEGIDLGAGVVDSDYRGEVKVILINNSKHGLPFRINKGDKIAQMIFEKTANIKMVRSNFLSKTKRGKGGFGSTGKQ